MRDPRLAQNWTKSRVLDCHDGKQDKELIRFLRERYIERFFDPIRCLRKAPGNEQGYGFAVMSLCCLLVETIQCYRLGWPSSSPKEFRELEKLPANSTPPDPEYKLKGPFHSNAVSSAVAFEKFFAEPRHQPFFPGVSGTVFYENIRCGLLHQAQTKSGWRIVRTGRFWDDSPGRYAVNRDEFSQRLEDCFEALLKELDGCGWDDSPWKGVRKKIWWLAQTS